MPPQLIPCPFCDRLYTHFSIDLHQPQCLSNPNRRVKLPKLTRSSYTSVVPINSVNQPLPALTERRSRSVGSSSINSSGSSDEAVRQLETSTRSISRNRRPKSKSQNPRSPGRQRTAKRSPEDSIIPSDKRTCFVCGEKVPEDDLIDHEIECEAEWRTQRRDFPSTIKVRSPRAMRIPSIDGTVDSSRMDMYAAESAERAQRTRCLRCCRHVPFAHVPQHQCTRFEPTVQFYF